MRLYSTDEPHEWGLDDGADGEIKKSHNQKHLTGFRKYRNSVQLISALRCIAGKASRTS